MHTSSSAKRTWSEFSSASEYTATVLMPSSRHAQMIRSAISPLLAIRIFLNITNKRRATNRERERRTKNEEPRTKNEELISLYREQPFPVLDRLAVLHVGADDLAL